MCKSIKYLLILFIFININNYKLFSEKYLFLKDGSRIYCKIIDFIGDKLTIIVNDSEKSFIEINEILTVQKKGEYNDKYLNKKIYYIKDEVIYQFKNNSTEYQKFNSFLVSTICLGGISAFSLLLTPLVFGGFNMDPEYEDEDREYIKTEYTRWLIAGAVVLSISTILGLLTIPFGALSKWFYIKYKTKYNEKFSLLLDIENDNTLMIAATIKF